MKKFYLLIISLVMSSLASFAQDTMYFKEGTQWIVEIYPDDPITPITTERLTLQSIPGAPSNIFALYTDSPNEYYFDSHCLDIKVEDEKVYFHLVDDTLKVPQAEDEGWYLMYDFGLKEGETCEIYEANGMRFNNSTSVCRETVRFIEYAPTDEIDSLCKMIMEDITYGEGYGYSDRGVWIKGIGDTAGLLNNGGYGRDGGGSRLIGVIYEGKEIYSRQPAEVKNITDTADFQVNRNGQTVTITASDLEQPCYIYSADGKLISIIDLSVSNNFTLPASGLYIIKIGTLSQKVF